MQNFFEREKAINERVIFLNNLYHGLPFIHRGIQCFHRNPPNHFRFSIVYLVIQSLIDKNLCKKETKLIEYSFS